jgi:hypothetical protein
MDTRIKTRGVTMKHPAIARVRGLLITLEQSNDPGMLLWAIMAIVEQLKELNKVVLSDKQQNKAGFQPPG